ncbi:MAG: four helix bundle protein [Phycisphaeraceae bacterium]|nr:four helix bundle protein [Phycisphaeraceae bacterium]
MSATNRVIHFEDLRIWQQARRLVASVYRDFKTGTGSRDFGFKDQVQRAGVSIMNNIAEGFERSSDNEFARFPDYAKGSCGELRNMYYIAEDQGYVESQIATERRSDARKISCGIASLSKHLRGPP